MNKLLPCSQTGHGLMATQPRKQRITAHHAILHHFLYNVYCILQYRQDIPFHYICCISLYTMHHTAYHKGDVLNALVIFFLAAGEVIQKKY